jgi:hypothetical protein
MRLAFSVASVLGVVVVLGLAAAACAGSESVESTDGVPDAPVLQVEGGTLPEAGPAVDANADADTIPDAADMTAPTPVTDLAGTPLNATSVTLTWTAPSDDSGKVTAYDVRVSPTPMTTEAELLAGKAVTTAPMPGAAGAPQTMTVSSLLPETAYHFALRARDAAGNWSVVSNDASATTKARATFRINEVALSNVLADGFDFIELTATKAGSAEGIEIKQVSSVVHKIAALDVAIGDTIVVHMTGLPGPAGFAQEDATKNKASSTAPIASATAYDVYSTTSGLTATDGILSVVDGTTALDSIVFANRDNGVATATMTALAAAKTSGQWTFAVTPADTVNDCETERDAVNTATAATETACGGFKSKLAAGISLNRVAGADTNTKADFYFAAQTPGAANAAVPPPSVVGANAGSATTVDLVFDQELAPASVVPASFTIAGLVVNAATASVNHVALTTDAQAGGAYDVTMAPTVTNLQGVAPVPLSARFCGFAALAPILTLSEVNASQSGGKDLIELTVTRGGSLNGVTLRANATAVAGATGTLLATLPAICAVTGDIVVVHLVPAATPTTDETLTKDQLPNATYAQNYDTAWDVRGSSTGLGDNNNVLFVRNADGTYSEAVAFSDGTAPAAAATYLSGLAFAQAQGLWLPANCGGAACNAASTPTAQAISANWTGMATTPAGVSVRRISIANDASSWAVGASSFGAP